MRPLHIPTIFAIVVSFTSKDYIVPTHSNAIVFSQRYNNQHAIVRYHLRPIFNSQYIIYKPPDPLPSFHFL
jgi:hypothetical protein